MALGWSEMEELYARVSSLPDATREQAILEAGLSTEDEASLRRLLAANAEENSFLSTGGAIASDLKLLKAGSEVGNWKIVELLGAGGMGEVYKVDRADGYYEQTAALKRITLSDEAAFHRFDRERQILARLEHPGLARLIDGGVDGTGAPFLVMELVDGQTLTDYESGRDLSLDEKLRKFLEICDALSHAHSRLVIHRDLKPTNILVTSSGTIKVIDFGVAGLLADSSGDLKAPMTLQYAAPEQLAGEAVSAATDIYSLGVTLFEFLTGQHPQRTLADQALPSASLPRDVYAIIGKATSRNPGDRYASVDAFAREIELYLTGYPVTARKGGSAYKAGLYVRRNSLALGLIVVLLAGFTATFWQFRKAETERDVALRERERLRTLQEATFVMFSEAGAAEGDTPTRALLSRAAEKVRDDFSESPHEVAPVLQMFGELFYLINDYQSAEPLLRTVSQLSVDGTNDDVIARASHDLAVVLLRSGEADEAENSLAKALEIWTSSPDTYEDQLIGSAMVSSQLAAEAGDPVKAEKILTDSLSSRIALSGETSLETAILLTNIGVARMRTGDMAGAIDVSARARDAYSALDKLETPDGLNTMNNLATLYHVTGRLDEAETAYTTTISLRQSLYGPSAALAVLLSNYGKLRLQKGELEEAIVLFDEALPMADQFAGSAGPPSLAIWFGLIEALALKNDPLGARESLVSLRSLLESSDQMNGAYAGLYELARGQVLIAEGKLDAANLALDQAEQAFNLLGPAAARYLAKVTLTRELIGQSGQSQP